MAAKTAKMLVQKTLSANKFSLLKILSAEAVSDKVYNIEMINITRYNLFDLEHFENATNNSYFFKHKIFFDKNHI